MWRIMVGFTTRRDDSEVSRGTGNSTVREGNWLRCAWMEDRASHSDTRRAGYGSAERSKSDVGHQTSDIRPGVTRRKSV